MTTRFFAQTVGVRQTDVIVDKCSPKRENQQKNVVAIAKIVVVAVKKTALYIILYKIN